jgi:cytoplasmic iron level regulating protein YaaA (DUF328/UPF0246 family)
MLVLLSPAKTFDLSSYNLYYQLSDKISTPEFLDESLELVELLKKYSTSDIAKLMGLSEKLSELNFQRFKSFSETHNLDNSRPAIFAFKGDVYKAIEVNKYNFAELEFANNALRIISGLYGILKALDLIQEYRLEMSTKLPNKLGGDLYKFWDDKITANLNQEPTEYIINLASQEYSSAISFNKLKHKVINVVFKERHKGAHKIIGVHAKKARGMMANFIIRNLIDQPQFIKEFNDQGYEFIPGLSSEGEYIFIR